MTRLERRAVLGALAAVPLHLLPGGASAAATQDWAPGLAAIERRSGFRLGVAVCEGASGGATGHRLDERFPMCTFKLLAAACVLARVDRGEERLDRRIVFSKQDLVPYSPITGNRTGGAGMTMAEICEAAVTVSDNTAGNLMLASFAGPEGPPATCGRSATCARRNVITPLSRDWGSGRY